MVINLVHRWGAGRSRGFAFAAFRSDDRKKFVGQLVDLCEDEGLEGIEFDWEGGEEELQTSEGCMRTPSDVFLCSSGFQKYDSQKLTAYVQVSALSKCLVNLSEVGSHVYHPIRCCLFPAPRAGQKRDEEAKQTRHPGASSRAGEVDAR